MKSKRTRFRARIIDVPSMKEVTGHAGDRYHVTVILLDHCGQEFPGHPEMRDGVDFKSLADEVLRAFKDSSAAADAGVVDCEDRSVSICLIREEDSRTSRARFPNMLTAVLRDVREVELTLSARIRRKRVRGYLPRTVGSPTVLRISVAAALICEDEVTSHW